MGLMHFAGRKLAQHLSTPRSKDTEVATCSPAALGASLQAGDVLLVAGNTRISTAIKYLTQSSWSHAALCVGDLLDSSATESEAQMLIEADIVDGIRALPLTEYSESHTRICRPVGLTSAEIHQLCHFAIERMGQRYDLKNIFDLARYLIPTPFVPTGWRRQLLALGSGDPTRAICSSLIAQAFQSVKYPILPLVFTPANDDPMCIMCSDKTLRIRHHSLFTPRDFDVSPYFQIIKPSLARGFDPSTLRWE